MKQCKKKFVVFVSLITVFNVYPMEFGKHDGGDYCFYVPGCKQGTIYPSLEQKQALIDNYYHEYKDSGQESDNQVKIMNFEDLRKMFPIFNTVVNNYPLCYLDSGATAQMPQAVMDAIVQYYATYKSNVGRGLYSFAERATQMFEDTREKVASFIGAKKQEIIFTPGATAGINLVVHMWAQYNLEKGDEIIVSEVEHNANFIPWQQFAQQVGLILTIVPINEYGVVDPDTLAQYVSEKTKLVALYHQSNVLGTTNDIAALAQVAHSVGAKILVDAAQSVVHQKIDVEQLECDFLVFSAHKLYGPTGVGVLFVKQDLFDQCVIQNFGGGMVYEVTEHTAEFKQMPHCMEAGTQPIAQVIGLAAAIDFVQKYINFEQAQQHETKLVCSLAEQLLQIPGMTIISHIPQAGEHGNVVTFIIDNHHAYDLAERLNKFGIAVRAGFHCVHLYHEKLGDRASVRVSFSVYNTQAEVDFFVKSLKSILAD